MMRCSGLCLVLIIVMVFGSFVATPVFADKIDGSAVVPASIMNSIVIDKNLQQRIRGLEFKKVTIGTTDVYWARRLVNGAIVEGDSVVFQVKNGTHKLLKSTVNMQRTVASDRVPVVTRETAESKVRGTVQFSLLYYISPDSIMFPIKPAPQDPCWVVRSVENGGINVTIINAVTGEILGYGIPPPSIGYTMAGSTSDTSCNGDGFRYFAQNAMYQFKDMGYSTLPSAYLPTNEEIRQVIQNPDIAMFYEVGHSHGTTDRFQSGCSGDGIAFTTASDIQSWIADYPKMPFTFLASCSGMCDTGEGTLSYAFSKGSSTDTVTVGFCGMMNGPTDPYNCEPCLNNWRYWQPALLTHMKNGETVKDAFDNTLLEYPECSQCVRFTGDPTLKVVPVLRRGGPVDTTTTIVTHTPDPSRRYENVSVTAIVTPNSGTIIPTGSVRFYEGITPLSSPIPVGSTYGEAATNLAFSSPGPHTITARYSSNNTNFFRDSVSQPITQTVNTAIFYPVGTKVKGTPNPSVYGQQVSMQATVSVDLKGPWTGNNVPPPPKGEVQWVIDNTLQGMSTIKNGQATGLISWLPPGSHTITANYLGDSTHQTSSGTYSQVINKAGSVVTWGSSRTSTTYGEPVTFTAIVSASAPGRGTPTGTVTFMDGNAILVDKVQLDGEGKATFTTTQLKGGTHTMKVNYNGDQNFMSSSGGPWTQTVQKATAIIIGTSSKTPTVFGEPVTFTTVVTAASFSGTWAPTGPMKLYESTNQGNNLLKTSPLDVTGVATFTVSSLQSGSHSLFATYDGDTNFTSARSVIMMQRVIPADTNIAVKSSKNPSVSGDPVTFTAKVVILSPGSGTISGKVSFIDGKNTLGTVEVGRAGTATLTTSKLTVATHSIQATYNGNANINPCTSDLMIQTVRPRLG